MSVATNLLAKYKGAASKVAANQGGEMDLPVGNYIGIITKGSLREGKDSSSVGVAFSLKVTEGECKNKPAFVSQNVVTKVGALNEVGIGIIKGIFLEMFGKGDKRVDDITEWEKLLKLAVGFRLKFRVYEKDERMNTKVTAVIPKEEATEMADSSEDVKSKVAEVEAEDEIPGLPSPKKAKKGKAPPVDVDEPEEEEAEATEEETEEEGHSEDDVRKHLTSLNRNQLLKFIVENDVPEMVKDGKPLGTKGLTEAQVIEKIISKLS